MDARVFCVFFVLISQCQAQLRDHFPGQKTSYELDNCPSANATFYHNNDKGFIKGERYVGDERKITEDFSIEINSTTVRAIAFEYRHNEVLFVDDEQPDSIFGVSQTVETHLVVQKGGAQFDWIVVDPVTNNIYFADNNRGIGICFGHGKNSSCTLLISRLHKRNATTNYHSLILYWQRGVMFWIQETEGQEAEVKMASMDGQHIRTLTKLKSSKGLALDTSSDHLYASRLDQLLKFYLQDHSTKTHAHYYSAKKLNVLNCYVHSLEKKVHDWDCTTTDCKPFNHQSTLFLKNAHRDPGTYDYVHAENSDAVSALILDTDKTPKPNPCKQVQCNGVCVLTETQSESLAECLPIISYVPEVEAIVEEKIRIEFERNPLNGILLATTVLLLLILVCFVALVVSPKLRIGLRNLITRIFGTKTTVGFSNPSRRSTVSTATQEI